MRNKQRDAAGEALTDIIPCADRKCNPHLFHPQVRVINPKSVTMGQLYGETDKATQEWKDGVLAVYFRQLASDPSEDRKWVLSVDDGSVLTSHHVIVIQTDCL